MSSYALLLCALGVGALMVHGKPHQCFLEEYSEALLNAAAAQQAYYPSYYDQLDDSSKRLGRSNELNSIQEQPKPLSNTAGGLGGLANYFAYNPLRGAAPAPGLTDPSKVGTGTGSKSAAPGEKTVGGKGANDTAAAAADVAKYYEQIKAQQEILAQQQLQQTLYQEQQRKQQEYLALQQQLQQQYYQQQQALLMLEQLNKNPAFVDQLAGFSNLKGSTAGATVGGATSSANTGSTPASSASPAVIDTKPENLDADKTKALNAKDQTVSNHLEAEKEASGKSTKHLEPRQADEDQSAAAAPSESAIDSAEDDVDDQDVSTIEKVYSVSSED